MQSRKEYLNAKNPFQFDSLEGRKWEMENHRNYCRQFLMDSGITFILPLLKKVNGFNRISPYFNDDIPLKFWDELRPVAQYIFDAKKFTESEYPTANGQLIYSQADVVSMAKTLAWDYLLANGYEEKWECDRGCYHGCLIKTI